MLAIEDLGGLVAREALSKETADDIAERTRMLREKSAFWSERIASLPTIHLPKKTVEKKKPRSAQTGRKPYVVPVRPCFSGRPVSRSAMEAAVGPSRIKLVVL